MSEQARQLLIERAKLNVPINYETFLQQLGHLGYNPDILTNTLRAIAEHEKENDRPLLTVMAKYKGRDQWGPKFYEIAKELGYLKDNEKADKHFAHRMQRECHEYWSTQKVKPIDVAQKHKMDFFTKEEVLFLSNWAGRVYEKDNTEHIAAKTYIMNSLGIKTVYWSKELVKRLPAYETFNWRMWSQPGWDDTSGTNKQVARFKHYTWARIYKKGDENKDIFFTIGADSEEKALVYKLDYYFESDSNLNANQKEVVKNNIPIELRWNTISIDDLQEYSWEVLINKISLFIAEHTVVYDELIKLVWGNVSEENLFTNHLRKCIPSLTLLSELPANHPSFEGVDVDFITQTQQFKEIGDAGEDLVIKYERSKLRALGKNDLADKVEKVKDGRGFDILSFNEQEEVLYIEVKTTRGNENTPFDLSLNEYLFAQKNHSYCIYRLYNYEESSNKADFFVIKDPVTKLLFQPMSFKAYYKA